MLKPLDKKLELLGENLQEMKQVLIGYSGGVDSTFLLAMAKQTLNHNLQAITISSPLIPKIELNQAIETAKKLGVIHKIISLDVLKHTAIKTNQQNRCYLCKKMIFTHLQHIAKEHNLLVIEGSTADDTTQYRPGRKALQELHIRSPLMEVGLTKQEIRTASKQKNLPTWDKPASPCLATRFPYNTTITEKLLTQVSQAEQHLHTLGFTVVRVRHHNDLARIEVPQPDIPVLIQKSNTIYKKLRELGYRYITIDLYGYNSGCYDGDVTI
jgi:uncharacterized protein